MQGQLSPSAPVRTWELLVFGPAFAHATKPASSCFTPKFSSSKAGP